ncbi:MAG: (d)CMP kinase [Elusimicrobiota bacterium]|jgi:cytidylate kinase|nr:(d)CMP kinase [Elusimicrobiota bacterium]
MSIKIITIDGPAGSGKSTIAKILAEKLDLTYINSGALYRAFSYWILQDKKFENYNKKDIAKMLENDNNEIFDKIKNFDLDYKWQNNKLFLYLDSKNITDLIRTEEISNFTSLISKNLKVRKFITDIQHKIADKNNVIAEGRDSGTVVFPNATKKFFLTADLNERVRRRILELKKSGEVLDENSKDEIQKIKEFIKNRDFQDETREFAPLKKAKDAIEIDTTGKSIDEVVEIILEKI